MIKRWTKRLIAMLIGVAIFSSVQAESLPLWEIGVGGGALRVPDYRGGDHVTRQLFPVVIPFYRGKYIRSDDQGVRGEFFKTDRVRLDFSIDGGVPVDSNDNPVRSGMPDLDATLQIGPALNVKLWEQRQPSRSLILFLPVRKVLAIDSKRVEGAGYTFSPQLTYYQRVRIAGCPWKLGLTAGLQFGSNKHHDYYYKVAPQFATPARPSYDAGGGFGGYRFIGTFHCRYDNKWISFFGRYDRIDGAVFEDSPLVRRRDGIAAGFVFTYFLAKSKTQVESKDWYYE